jgi:hypothetical protein
MWVTAAASLAEGGSLVAHSGDVKEPRFTWNIARLIRLARGGGIPAQPWSSESSDAANVIHLPG